LLSLTANHGGIGFRQGQWTRYGGV
jgi:hypothetical protein